MTSAEPYYFVSREQLNRDQYNNRRSFASTFPHEYKANRYDYYWDYSSYSTKKYIDSNSIYAH